MKPHSTPAYTTLVFLLMSILLLAACKESGEWRKMIDKNYEDTNVVLEQFITQMDAAPQKWETHLNGVVESLNEETQSTFRNEISQMGKRLTMDMGTQMNCSSTIIPDLLDKKMSWISKQLLLKKENKKHKDINFDLPIILCGIDLPIINLNLAEERRNVIRANGFGFQKENELTIRFYKDRNTFQSRKQEKFVYKTSDFNFVFDLSDLEDEYLSKFDHIALTSNDIVVSEIPIIKKKGEKTKVEMANLPPADYFPPLTHGDKDFKRHCMVWSRLRLEWSENQIWYNIFMKASEFQKGDQTNLEGWSDTTFVYAAPDGYAISAVDGHDTGRNNFNLTEKFFLGGKGDQPKNHSVPFTLGRMDLQGDTKGDDVGDGDDSAYAKFRPMKPIKVSLVEVTK